MNCSRNPLHLAIPLFIGWLAICLPAPSVSAETVSIDVATNGAFQMLFGVNDGPFADPGPYSLSRSRPTNNPAITSGYRDIGVKLVRVHDYFGDFDMKEMYPDQGANPLLASSYNFTNSDARFLSLITNGFEPYLRIGNSASAPSPTAPTNQANWVLAASQVVKHFTDTNLWGSNYVRYVEIWNEPDSALFWDASPQPLTKFVSLFVDTAKRLKTDFPTLKIGGPGMTSSSFSGLGTNWLVTFVQQIAASNAPLDFYSWHTYSLQPLDYSNSVALVRGQLNLRGYTNATQHVTEWNSPNTTPALSRTRTSLEAAAPCTAVWMVHQLAGIEVSTIYRGPDMYIDTPQDYGIFYADAEPKATAVAARLWNWLTSYTNRLTTSTTSTNLWAMSGRRGNDFAVLMSNTSSNAATWQLNLANGRVPQNLQTIAVVPLSTNAIYPNVIYWTLQTNAITTDPQTLNPYGVQLVTFNVLSDYDHWAQTLNGLTGTNALATADPDGDGFANESEYLAGTDPNNAASALRFTSASASGTNFKVSWLSVTGKTYQLQSADDPGSAFADVAGTLTNAVNTNTAQTLPLTGSNRFYRIRLVTH